jgi:hypothetical protein
MDTSKKICASMLVALGLIAGIVQQAAIAQSGGKLPAGLVAALEKGAPFELYSILGDFPGHNRTTPESAMFHGWPILGKTVVRDAGQKARLAAELAGAMKAFGPNDPMAACFFPRHGIRVVHEKNTYDFLICFQCARVEVYAPGNTLYQVSGAPEKAFDQVLTAAKIPLSRAVSEERGKQGTDAKK